jgi:hypothetical protein
MDLWIYGTIPVKGGSLRVTGDINERRRLMIKVFVKTWSLNSAVRVVSKKFNVRQSALRVDWSRRHQWSKEVFSQISYPFSVDIYLMAIHKTLRQIEAELRCNTNASCRVGLLKTKADILFKLIEIQKSVFCQKDLMERMENLEKKLEFLDASKKR